MIFLPLKGKAFPFWPVVGEEGFEPPTPWFVATCSNPLSYRPRPVSTGSVPGSTLKKKRNLSSPQLFRVKKMWKRLSLYNKGAFRGVKWERRDFIIGVLNKTTLSFFSFSIWKRKVIRMRGVKLFIILASSYFSAGPPLQYRHRSRV